MHPVPASPTPCEISDEQGARRAPYLTHMRPDALQRRNAPREVCNRLAGASERVPVEVEGHSFRAFAGLMLKRLLFAAAQSP